MRSVFIHKRDEGNFDCLFSGHIDVVRADKSQYDAKIENGKIYGRGAIDMKSQVAIMLYFMKHYNWQEESCYCNNIR